MLLISSAPEAEEKAFASSDYAHTDVAVAVAADSRKFYSLYIHLHEKVLYSVTPRKVGDTIVFRWRLPPTIKGKHFAN